MTDTNKPAPLTLTDLDELERLEREATGGPWVDGYVSGFCQKKHGPDEKGPWHGNGFCQYEYSVTKTDYAHQLASTSAIKEVAGNYDYEEGGIINPEDHALIVTARNNLPQLLALARVGLLAVEVFDDWMKPYIGESRATVAVIEAFRDLIDAYKEKHK